MENQDYEINNKIIMNYIINMMFLHAPSLLRFTVFPIPKNLRLDFTISSTFRVIALSNIFGNVLDKTGNFRFERKQFCRCL